MSFEDCAIVACGTLRFELNYLKKTGFLNAKKVLYTKPGRHEDPIELESQLPKYIEKAGEYADKVIVIYGDKFCYINPRAPAKTISMIIEEQRDRCSKITKIKATHCVDMLSNAGEREQLSGGAKVFWLTPGWIVYRHFVFQDWDKGKANETFPQNTGGAMLLDGVGFWDRFTEEHPEDILDFSDWMGIPIIPIEVSLERFKTLLLEALARSSLDCLN